jgi:hypothetical protein
MATESSSSLLKNGEAAGMLVAGKAAMAVKK